MMARTSSSRTILSHACAAAAVVAAAALGGCAVAPAVAERAPTCRPSTIEPGVEVCQDGGRISVVAAHGATVDAETLAREAVDVSDLPRALPQAEILGSDLSDCRAAQTGSEVGVADGEDVPAGSTVNVECRLRLTLQVLGVSP